MCYTRGKIEGGVGALRESDYNVKFLKPNGQSRNLNVYADSLNEWKKKGISH